MDINNSISKKSKNLESAKKDWKDKFEVLKSKVQKYCDNTINSSDIDKLIQILFEKNITDNENISGENKELSNLCDELKKHAKLREFLWAEDIVMEEMNKKHAVARLEGGETCYLTFKKDGSFDYESKNSFRNFYESQQVDLPGGKKSKADIFLKNAHQRRYEKIVCIPMLDPEEKKRLEADGCYNQWRGFSIEPKPLEDKGLGKDGRLLFWDHIEYNICSNNQELYIYVRKWLALIFQKPNEVHTAVILIGSEGVGKNFFAEMIGKLLGPHFAPLNSLQDIAVGGRFTFHLINSTLVHVSECESSDKGDIARIRNMITGKQIPFEAKNKNPITKDNTLHFIFSTNSCLPMKISADDRRFVVLPVSDACKGNRKFFASIDKALLSFYRNHIKAPTRDTKEKKFLLDLSKREKMRLKYFIFEKKHSVVDPIS